ncbi:MAG: hypothetical protein PHW13_09700 [Methylococcales bacterium]|nr:hypothetical protein [Methylococcales bacterium]
MINKEMAVGFLYRKLPEQAYKTLFSVRLFYIMQIKAEEVKQLS